MKRKLIRIFMTNFFTILLVCGLSGTGYADIPLKMNFQGSLVDAAGSPITDTVEITFCIYNLPEGGIPLWCEVKNVMVENGIYNVILGEVTALDLPFDEPYYLGVTVETDS